MLFSYLLVLPVVRLHANASVPVHARAPEANLVVVADPVDLLGVVTVKSLGGVVAGRQSGALRLPAGNGERKRQRGSFASLMTRSHSRAHGTILWGNHLNWNHGGGGFLLCVFSGLKPSAPTRAPHGAR